MLHPSYNYFTTERICAPLCQQVLFDTESRSFSNAFIGTHLVWQYDDLSTAAYVDGSNILSIDGRTLAELDLAENEYVYGLSYSQDGTVLTATIVSSEETERIVRLTLP